MQKVFTVLSRSLEQYGTASWSAINRGTVFKLVPRKKHWSIEVLHQFPLQGDDGQSPEAGVIIAPSGTLYGTTNAGGGTNNAGVVFQVVPNKGGGWTESVLYTFCENDHCSDGGTPLELVMDKAENLFGTTAYGGSGYGVVFKLASGVWTENVLYSFTGGNDGSYPSSGVIRDEAGNLYGETRAGGASGWGVVFQS